MSICLVSVYIYHLSSYVCMYVVSIYVFCLLIPSLWHDKALYASRADLCLRSVIDVLVSYGLPIRLFAYKIKVLPEDFSRMGALEVAFGVRVTEIIDSSEITLAPSGSSSSSQSETQQQASFALKTAMIHSKLESKSWQHMTLLKRSVIAFLVSVLASAGVSVPPLPSKLADELEPKIISKPKPNLKHVRGTRKLAANNVAVVFDEDGDDSDSDYLTTDIDDYEDEALSMIQTTMTVTLTRKL